MSLGLSPNPVIVAELVMPGFAVDLSTWVCSIEEDGALRQEIMSVPIRHRPPLGRMTFSSQVDPSEVSEILDAARVGGFDRLSEYYYACEYTDLPTLALSFRTGSRLKRVQAYGPGALAYDGSADMQLFVDLWERIVRYLPYGRN